MATRISTRSWIPGRLQVEEENGSSFLNVSCSRDMDSAPCDSSHLDELLTIPALESALEGACPMSLAEDLNSLLQLPDTWSVEYQMGQGRDFNAHARNKVSCIISGTTSVHVPPDWFPIFPDINVNKWYIATNALIPHQR
ncbi:hypothetical protein PENANT_c038G10754 [Penicillium antarcticum]|uniref:Uncharacterized protein n=1 Tax=Penicillium antarcticum TaxID=416450 RepID=A0A1V6PT82_9EURO|nr:hypothetical protein PENANT_c038G10754 [Penicillium antarcticum]